MKFPSFITARVSLASKLGRLNRTSSKKSEDLQPDVKELLAEILELRKQQKVLEAKVSRLSSLAECHRVVVVRAALAALHAELLLGPPEFDPVHSAQPMAALALPGEWPVEVCGKYLEVFESRAMETLTVARHKRSHTVPASEMREVIELGAEGEITGVRIRLRDHFFAASSWELCPHVVEV